MYVAFYTLGRVWIESVRIDAAETVLGLRLNVWTSIVVFALAVVGYIVAGRRNDSVNEQVEPETSASEEAEQD